MSDILSVIDGRTERLPGYAYKLDSGGYAIEYTVADDLDIDENEMSVWIPFADGNRRDGVGDLLEVTGIDTSRHRQNPICLFDHGKAVQLPIGMAEDRKSKDYTVVIDPIAKVAKAKCYFYQGMGNDFPAYMKSGGDGKAPYDHALFCQQLFHLMAERFVRGGSIGYQIIHAKELPPDYHMGTPKGMHLLNVRMLECSAVVLPANMDTVRKALSLNQVCGKALSPVLVKSLSAYLPEQTKTVVGFTKELDRQGGESQKEKSMPSDNISPEKAEQMLKDGTAHGHPLTDNQRRMLGAAASRGKSMGDIRSQYRKKDAKKVGAAIGGVIGGLAGLKLGGNTPSGAASTAQIGVSMGTRLGAAAGEKIQNALGRLRGKKKPEEKALGDIRRQYRSAKGLVHRRKKSSPGTSIILCKAEDIPLVADAAKQRGLQFDRAGTREGMERVRLSGDDSSIDAIAAQYGQPISRRMVGKVGVKKEKSLDTVYREVADPPSAYGQKDLNKSGRGTNMADNDVELADKKPANEPYGAQILRRLHGDHSFLLRDYDEAMGPLDNDDVRAHLQDHLGHIEGHLTGIEKLFKKVYGHLPDLDGAGKTDEKDMTEDEVEGVKDEIDDQMEDTEEEKDMDTMDDVGTPSSSGDTREAGEPSAEEVIEGMENAEEGDEMEDEEKAMGAPNYERRGYTANRAKKKSLSQLRAFYKSCCTGAKDLTEEEAGHIKDELDLEAQDTEEQPYDDEDGSEEFQEYENEEKAQDDEEMEDKEDPFDPHHDDIRESSDYLRELSEAQNFGESERMKSFHYHKVLGKVHSKVAPMFGYGDMKDLDGYDGKDGDKPAAVPATPGDAKKTEGESRKGKWARRAATAAAIGGGAYLAHRVAKTPAGIAAISAVSPTAGRLVAKPPDAETAMRAGVAASGDIAKAATGAYHAAKPHVQSAVRKVGESLGVIEPKKPGILSRAWNKIRGKDMDGVMMDGDETSLLDPELQKRLDTLANAGSLFQKLSETRDFGDPHRKMCGDMHKAMEETFPARMQEDEYPEDEEEFDDDMGGDAEEGHLEEEEADFEPGERGQKADDQPKKGKLRRALGTAGKIAAIGAAGYLASRPAVREAAGKVASSAAQYARDKAPAVRETAKKVGGQVAAGARKVAAGVAEGARLGARAAKVGYRRGANKPAAPPTPTPESTQAKGGPRPRPKAGLREWTAEDEARYSRGKTIELSPEEMKSILDERDQALDRLMKELEDFTRS